MVVNAVDPALYQTPEALNRVGVGVAIHICARAVMHAQVNVTDTNQMVIGFLLVSVNGGTLLNVILNKRRDGGGFGVLYNGRLNLPVFPFGNAHNRGLVLRATPALAAGHLAAEIGLIHLNLAAERIAIFLKALTNQLAHAPCGLIGDARFALDLLSGNPAARLRHQIDGIEPRGQRRAGLVENGPGGGVYVVTAILAAIGLAGVHQVVLRDLAADVAVDAIEPAVVFQPFKASVIVGKVFLEVLNRVFLHGYTYHNYILLPIV